MRRYVPILILAGCVAMFAFGIAQLFELRVQNGDVYAPYSSLRADPLGAMAIYESVGKIPGMTVRRDFSQSNVLPTESETVYLHLATESHEWLDVPEDLAHEIKGFMARGGRLVITYYPQTQPPNRLFWDDNDPGTNIVKSATAKSKGTNAPSMKQAHKKKKGGRAKDWVNLEDEWKFHESFAELPQGGDHYGAVTVRNTSDPALPASLIWHSGMIFTNCGSDWHVLYTRGPNPVIMERRFGKGSVVLASDSYFVSNEAMLKDRQAQLLAWMIGAHHQVVFDEAHLGVVESPGVAGLMRKYRLHGLAAGLLLLAGLFIWMNTCSLVPPTARQHCDEVVAGKDSASGFVNLLRRNIPTQEILAVCFEEWRKSTARPGKISNPRFQQAEAIFQGDNNLPPRERNPLATHQKISAILDKRKPL